MADRFPSAEIEALLSEFARSDARELHVRNGEIEIFLSSSPLDFHVVSRNSTADVRPWQAELTSKTPLPPAASKDSRVPAQAEFRATEITPGAVIVRAPNIGTFYGAPKPGAAAYVGIGSMVTKGAELCLIEVMKLFTAVCAEVDGRIDAILASDGDMLEAGQPLFAIVTD